MVRCLPLQRLYWLFALSVAAILSSLAGGGPGAHAANAQLAFSPSSSSVAVGANVAVNITVASVSNLGGYDVYLQFNPAIVNVASLTDADFVTGGGNIVACNPATIDNSAGTATAACATLCPFCPIVTPVPGVSTVGPTALMQATFTGVATGTSTLTLTGTTLEDPNGDAIAAKLGSGSITTTAASVGGVTELVDGSALPPRANAAGPSMHLYIPIAIAAGLLAAVAAAAGYSMRRRHST